MKKTLILVAFASMFAVCACNSEKSSLTPTSTEPTETSVIPATYTVTWLVDGEETTEEYTEGETPSFKGETDKESDNTYTYTFTGWEPAIAPVTSDITYTAQYEQQYIDYVVTWVVDGRTTTENYHFRDEPSYKGNDLVKEGNAQYTYTFDHWEPELDVVTKDITYTAVFEQTVNSYKVTWVVDGNSTTVDVEYGVTPECPVSTDKESDAQYDYTFNGWDKEVVPVTGDVTYTATYLTETRKYNVTWVIDGEETTDRLEYGTMPTPPTDTDKEPSESTVYTFVGWDKEVTTVTGDVTYTAVYSETTREYVVSFYNNGVLVGQESVPYGSKPTLENIATPTKTNLTFSGWKIGDRIYSSSEDMPTVTSDMSFEASFKAKITIKHFSVEGTELVDPTTVYVDEGEYITKSFGDIYDDYLGNQYPTTPMLGLTGDQNKTVTAYYSDADTWNASLISDSFAGGTGTEDDPYLISSAADFAYFSQTVNDGETYVDKFIKLTLSLNLNANFPRIGTADSSFQGTFLGNNCLIGGVDYAGLGTRSALFYGMTSGTISDLNVFSNPTVGQYGSILVGRALGSKIINCRTYGLITQTGANGAGGIAGGINSSTTISNCENYAGVYLNSESYNKTAGIVGMIEATGTSKVENCNNFGFVTGAASVGGIAGELTNNKQTVDASKSSIVNCHNYGTIDSRGYGNVGGVVGLNTNGVITNCSNHGKVTAVAKHATTSNNASTCAGIVGQAAAGTVISYCDNFGLINGSLRTGGIAGNCYCSITHCTNYGKVTNGYQQGNLTNNGNWCGGIAGVALAGSAIEDCVNNGDVQNEGLYVGGILGCVGNNVTSTIKNCVNNGTIIGDGNGVGGISGGGLGAASVLHVIGSTNHGTIQGPNKVGGIIGAAKAAGSDCVDCVNDGELICKGELVGQMIGEDSTGNPVD